MPRHRTLQLSLFVVLLVARAPLLAQVATARVDSAMSPLTLAAVLDLALRQHPLVDAARSRVAAARGALLTARTVGNPLLTYQVENAAFPGRPAAAGVDREISTFATLPLEPFFQRGPRTRRAQNDIQAAEAELNLARRSVVLDAARAYFRVAEAQSAAAGAGDVATELQSLAVYTQARVKEGATSEGDLIRVQVELDRAESSLALSRAELARAQGELMPYLDTETRRVARLASVTVALNAASDPLPIGVEGASSDPLRPLDDYVARARSLRPDLIAARARVAAANADATYQRTLAVRQLGATFGTKRSAGATTMIAGISVPLPLFDQNRGEVQWATSERVALEQELVWRERQVTAQVAASHAAARQLSGQRKRLAGGAIARAEEARRIALAAYREGAASLLQVIDASRALAELRLAYYRIVFAERESMLELDVISGGEILDPSLSPLPSGVRPAPAGDHP